MSDSSSDIAGLIAEASQAQVAYHVKIAGMALVFYDYALTFPTEVSEVWNSKFSGAQVLFFATRYSYMLYVVMNGAFSFPQNPSETMSSDGRHFYLLGRHLTIWLIRHLNLSNICNISKK
ncbi:hypothetical protein BD410DRAFT_650191 [Rickenella mellea]|uniref:DUF6533 domain-containing protein n=1 Tax=Rickenella mellea TaxID=50990 RepID=A0A4Y7PML7_9AGAM|nr:hypothetical protein BD410DRAFT_650191 [Rickenella mellea]